MRLGNKAAKITGH